MGTVECKQGWWADDRWKLRKRSRTFGARLHLFQPCSCAVCGELHPLAWGSTSSQSPLGCPRPSAPQGAPGRVSGRCQSLFPAGTMSRQAGACPAAGRGGVPVATMQQPLRKSRHMDTLGCPFLLLMLNPTVPMMHAWVGGCSPTGLLLLQPGPWRGKGSLWAWGDTSNSSVEGLSCQSRASIASFGKPRHSKVETWPVCKQAPGPRGFLYKGCFSR